MSVQTDLTDWIATYGAPELRLGELLCDAHARAGADALIYEDATRRAETTSFAELAERSRRLAGTLRAAGVQKGDRVGVLLPRSPELFAGLLAVWRLGAVHVPLFTAFGPDAVSYRLAHSRARALIADAENRPKLAERPATLAAVVSGGARPGSGDLDLHDAMASGEPLAQDAVVSGEDPFVLLYTSGTTGKPKGVDIPVRAIASFHAYMRHALDVRADDVFWNVSDPGWGYGLWFGVIGPLLLGQPTVQRNVAFDADDLLDALARLGVTNLTAAPTVYRSLRAHGVPAGYAERVRLRAVSSAGEPLNPELLAWSREALGAPIHDHFGQSELGMPIGFPHHPELRREPAPGSMGVSAPGFAAVVLDARGEPAADGEQGDLAIDVERSPLYWFRGYFEDAERTAERFPHGPRHYLTGDTARVEDGLLRFASRADDVITSAGYRIGPFDVESALIQHPAVAEVAVIGTPDELRGEVVTAFVVLAGPAGGDEEAVREDLQAFVRARLSKHLFPRRILFVASLPRTPSGKVRRTELRERWSAEAGIEAAAPTP